MDKKTVGGDLKHEEKGKVGNVEHNGKLDKKEKVRGKEKVVTWHGEKCQELKDLSKKEKARRVGNLLKKLVPRRRGEEFVKL